MASFSAEEVERLRGETPGCAHVVHFNHAGASLMPQPVIDATVGHLQREATIGGYEAADEAEERIEGAYATIARLINAKPAEIAIVENATRAWDMAFYSIPFKSGDRILTSRAEYASNVLAFLQIAERGVSVEIIPNDSSGQVSVGALADMLDKNVKLVAISHMPTNGGLLQPAGGIGALTRQSGAIYMVDACQTVGQLPMDVAAIRCDILTATSRKYLRGPRGVGFLYVRQSLIERLVPPMLDLHAATWSGANRYEVRPDARRFENWESFVAGRLGMATAIDYAMDLGLERIWATIQQRAEQLRARLADLPGVTVHDLGRTKGGIVTFTSDRVDADQLASSLRQDQINVTTTSVSGTPYDMEARGLTKLLRASVHYLTTESEIDRLIAAVDR
jgi:cysteine desulfurase / selenocysteine lyase